MLRARLVFLISALEPMESSSDIGDAVRRLLSLTRSDTWDTDRVRDLDVSLRFLRGDGERDMGERVAILLGDGEPNFSEGVTDRERCLRAFLSRLRLGLRLRE